MHIAALYLPCPNPRTRSAGKGFERSYRINHRRTGTEDVTDKLFSTVYADLRRIAAGQSFLAHKDGLRTTSILHEAFFRLAKPESLLMNDREHFYAVAARAMRQ